MKKPILLIFLIKILFFSSLYAVQNPSKIQTIFYLSSEVEEINHDNFKPIIAILSIPHKKGQSSVISTDIVRFIQEGGARVLPIHYKTPWSTVKSLLPKLNGFVFQGGGPKHWPQKELPKHFNLQWKIFKWVVRSNKNGMSFPLLGICLGFQRLLEMTSLWSSGQKDFAANTSKDVYNIRNKYFGTRKVDSQFHAENIDLIANNSVLFNESYDLIQRFPLNNSKKIFFLNNKFGLSSRELLNNKYFNESWRLVAKTQDYNGKSFVAAIEHVKFPFFGLQLHPEKIQFDSNDHLNHISSKNHLYYIPSNEEAILVNSRISLNFVTECKKNKNRFQDTKDYESKLIDNYKSYIHIGGDISSYYSIGLGYKDFEEMETVLPEMKGRSLFKKK